MCLELRIDAKRHPRRPELEIEPRVVQLGADDRQRFDAERLQLLRRGGHLRQRAAAEWTIQPPKQAKQQRNAATIVRQSNPSILVHRRNDEIRGKLPGLNGHSS
jgi:hypothetical protein